MPAVKTEDQRRDSVALLPRRPDRRAMCPQPIPPGGTTNSAFQGRSATGRYSLTDYGEVE